MDLLVFGNGLPLPGMAGSRNFETVANRMRRSWVNFARTGNPSVPEFEWPEYSLETRLTARINDEFTLLQDPYTDERAALGELLTMNWPTRGV